MKCNIHLKRQGQDIEYEFSEGEIWSEMLLSIGIIPDTVIIFKNDDPVPEDEYITEGTFVIAETASRG